MGWSMQKTTRISFGNKLLLVIVLTFLLKLALLPVHPLYLDECLYSEMVEEQLESPSLVPTYLGFDTSWKPPFFFWAYALPVKALHLITADIEIIYRLPNLLLGALNIWLVFILFKKITDERKAFYTALLYAFCALIFYADLRVLLDTMNTTLILASLLSYFGHPEPKNIVLGALFAFLAAITKSVVAFVIPIVVLAHFWEKRQLSALFVLSLLAAPLGIAFHYLFLSAFAPDLANAQFTYDVMGKLAREGMNYGENLQLSYGNAFVYAHALFVFAALGFLKFGKEKISLSAWFIMIVFALLGSSGMMWYFYPFIPVLAYFSVKALSSDVSSGREKYDVLFQLAIGLIIVLNLAVLYIWYDMWGKGLLETEREIGSFLAGKQNVAFIGDYQPTITALSYKILNERAQSGKYHDFGWVILTRNETLERQMEIARDFATDYHTSAYSPNEDNFAQLFWKLELFRKPSNITHFDYVMVSIVDPNATVEWRNNISIAGYELLREGKKTVLFVRSGLSNETTG